MVQKAIKELGFLVSKAPQDLQVRDGSAVQIQCMLILLKIILFIINFSLKILFRKNIDKIWKQMR